MQVEASNHLKLLWLRVTVVSVKEKARIKLSQVSIWEMNASEPLLKCRKRRNVIKTRGESLTWDKPGGNLLTDQAVAGTEAART